MNKETQHKKALVNLLYNQTTGQSKKELQNQLFFEEETTDNWSLEKCRIQYVIDQLDYIESGNFDEELEETWQLITSKERQ
jgi:hypothetical protein